MNTDSSLCLLNGSHGILKDYLDAGTPLDQIDRLMVAVHNIKMVLDKNPDVKFVYKRYPDLEMDDKHLRERHIPYLDANAKACYISAKEAPLLKEEAVLASGETVKITASNCKKGNLAIGQVYINGEEGFCKRYSVECSLLGIAQMWLKESKHLYDYIQKTKPEANA